ncbi:MULTISPECIES: transposase [Streptomyces]|uniref:transposase n=1 Tax=Streptomyces TaxID=1883 RepID=UPI0037FCEA1D
MIWTWRGDLTDAEGERQRPFLPISNRRCGRWRDHRQVIDGILHRVRTGVQWRDLAEQFGPWKTVCERPPAVGRRNLGTPGRLLQQVQAEADMAGAGWVGTAAAVQGRRRCRHASCHEVAPRTFERRRDARPQVTGSTSCHVRTLYAFERVRIEAVVSPVSFFSDGPASDGPSVDSGGLGGSARAEAARGHVTKAVPRASGNAGAGRGQRAAAAPCPQPPRVAGTFRGGGTSTGRQGAAVNEDGPTRTTGPTERGASLRRPAPRLLLRQTFRTSAWTVPRLAARCRARTPRGAPCDGPR